MERGPDLLQVPVCKGLIYFWRMNCSMNSCCSASTLVKAVCWVDSLQIGESVKSGSGGCSGDANEQVGLLRVDPANRLWRVPATRPGLYFYYQNPTVMNFSEASGMGNLTTALVARNLVLIFNRGDQICLLNDSSYTIPPLYAISIYIISASLSIVHIFFLDASQFFLLYIFFPMNQLNVNEQ